LTVHPFPLAALYTHPHVTQELRDCGHKSGVSWKQIFWRGYLWMYQRKQYSTKMSRFIPAKAFDNFPKPAISATPFACLLKAFTL
jgi:hypothetical protein